MKTRDFALVVLMGLGLVGCNTTEKYAANNAAGQRWLDEHGRSASINLGGAWYSEVWGGARFTQSGRTVTGSLGNYNVRGVVSGGQAYLVVHSGGWVYYTAVLAKPSANQLSGFYSGSVPFSPADQEGLELKRVFD